MIWDIIGYTAAVISNISMFPQAYEVHKIIKVGDYDKLSALSLTTLFYMDFGCSLWLTYAINKGVYPIIVGSVLCMTPTTYMIILKLMYRGYTTNYDFNIDGNIIDISGEILNIDGHIIIENSDILSEIEIHTDNDPSYTDIENNGSEFNDSEFNDSEFNDLLIESI